MSSYRVASRLLFAFGLVGAVALWAAPGDAQDHEQTGDPPDLVARALGIDPTRSPKLDPEQKDLAKSVGRDVVCLCGTCPRHTITDCTCGWAGQNKRTIEQAVAKGMSREQIVGAYQEAYGLKVLPNPPNEGFGRMSYIVPYAAAGVGIFVLFGLGLRMRRRGKDAERKAAVAAAAARESKQLADSPEARKILERELGDLD